MGTGAMPMLSFEDLDRGNTMYFKPTAIGIVARRKLVVHNNSRVPLLFRCEIPAKLRGIVHIEPRVGRLRGNESSTVEVCFAPRAERQYCNSFPFTVRSITVNSGTQVPPVIDTVNLKVAGMGTSGAITFDPPIVDFGTTLVKTVETRELTLVNSSDCDLLYELTVVDKKQLSQVDLDGDGLVEGLELDAWQEKQKQATSKKKPVLQFSAQSAVLEARSRKLITVTFIPGQSGLFEFQVFCEITSVDKEGKPLRIKPSADDLGEIDEFKADPLQCKVVAKASFPTLVFEDCRCRSVSTDRLWTLLALTAINTNLATPLTRQELIFNQTSNPDFSLLPVYDIQFMPAATNSNTQEVLLGLKNPGWLSVDFNIKFPNESEVEMEQWADAGEPTAEELRLNRIIDNKLFEITPRSGSLGPQDTLTMKIAYHYKMAGEHDLPVTLQVSKGKQLTLKLCGKTLEPAQPQLVLPSQELDLVPMAIGQNDPPLQPMELRNTGGSELTYEVELGEVDDLNRRNYGFEILKCLNPRGVIKSKSRTLLQWRFCPLQAKHYDVHVRVKYTGGYHTPYSGVEDLLLRADGFHPKNGPPITVTPQGGLMEIPTGPPKQQLLMVPNQLASLSLDRLGLGKVPQRSVSRQLVVLRNLHAENAVDFEWEPDHPLITAGLVKLSPRRGRLAVGEHVICNLTFHASGQPIVINDDIQCVLTEVLPPPEQIRHGTGRSRLTTGSTRGGTAEINPAKEVRKIGTRMHTSCVGRTTKAKAPKEALRESNKMDQQANQTSAGVTNHFTSTGGRGARAHARIVDDGDNSPNVLFLNVNVHVVELEAYQAERPDDRGFYIPQDATVVSTAGVSGMKEPAVLPPAELDGLVPQPEQEKIMETVLAALLQDLVAGADVREACEALPQEAETPFFHNFRDPTALEDLSTSSFDTSAAEPLAAGLEALEGDGSQEEAAAEAKRATILQDAESQELISRVMENTVFNLLQEASHGEFNVKVMPKRFLVAS
jgi:hypothetical protein